MSDTDEVTKMLDACGLNDSNTGGWVELRMKNISESVPLEQRFVERIGDWRDQIRQIIEGFNVDRHYNVWIGRSPRTAPSGRAADIDWATSVSFDFDCIREKGTGASDAAIEAAFRVAKLASAQLGGASILFSGNGYHVIARLKHPVDVRGRRDWWQRAQRAVETELWSRLVTEVYLKEDLELVRMDKQFDLPRVIRMAGTYNVKDLIGDAKLGKVRYCSFRHFNAGHVLDPEQIIRYATEEDYQRSYAPSAISDRASLLPVPDRFWAILSSGRDPQLVASWLGRRDDLPDRSGSGQDIALVHCLKQHRFSAEEAVAILSKSPGGKGRGNPRYWQLTVEKVYLH